MPEGKRLIAESVDCVGSGLMQEQISQLELTGDANEAGANAMAMHVSIVHIRSRFQITPPGPNFQAYQLLNTWAPEDTEIRLHVFSKGA